MDITGLTSAEVTERVKKGEVNSVESVVSRSYGDIIIKNTCTVFNLLLLAIGIVLIILGKPIDALAASLIIILNIIVATIQEIRAKRRLDKIALLMRPKVTVVREGKEIVIDQAEIVKDDVVKLSPGDQALVDGMLLKDEYLEMDESLLTGESSTVRKRAGGKIYSGSFCVTGTGYYTVEAFGDKTYASEIVADAKKFKKKNTPFQMEIAAVTELLIIIAFLFTVAMAIIVVIREVTSNASVDVKTIIDQIATNAVITIDMVPKALFLMIVIAYMIAAIRMADTGALLQNSNAVESMSHVDTVCMDKTGTITTNKLIFRDMVSFDKDAEELIAIFSSATGSRNKTIDAIIAKYGERKVKAIDEIRFSSERKYSAVKIEYNGEIITLILGAYTSLQGHFEDNGVEEIVNSFSKKGYRTTVFCKAENAILYNDEGKPQIPEMKAIAVIAIEDEIRKDCRESIDVFMKNGMEVKIISGDDPVTINSLFDIGNIPGERHIISGDQFEKLSPEKKTEAALKCNIFGRMKPQQKNEVITLLKSAGKYVAMVGDGVNDVKSLKTSNVGISLQSGAGAARGVSDIVLANDNFKALPKSLKEGKRTVSGMRTVLKLYLSRNFTFGFLILIVMLLIGSCLGNTILFLPTQASFYALTAVGIAAFLMTIWARPTDEKGAVLPKVLNYAVPVALFISLFAVLIYLLFYYLTLNGTFNFNFLYDSPEMLARFGCPSFISVEEMLKYYGVSSVDQIPIERVCEIAARNALLLFVILAGISQIFIIMPIRKFLSIDGRTTDDVKPTILAILLFGFVILVYSVANNIVIDDVNIGQIFIQLLPFEPLQILFIVAGVVIWFVFSIYVMKADAFHFITDLTQKWYNKRLAKMYNKTGEKNVEDND